MKKLSRRKQIQKVEKENYSLWALIVKLKAGNKSELSGQTGILHSHHIFGRRSNTNLRFDINNGVTLTQGEHFKVEMKQVPELIKILIDKRGEVWYDSLMLKKQAPTIHRSLQDLIDINNQLKSQLKELTNA